MNPTDLQVLTDPNLREAFRLRRAADLVDGVEGRCFHYLDAIEAVFSTQKKRAEIRHLIESSYHEDSQSFEDPGYGAAAYWLRFYANELDGLGIEDDAS
jgi:hypothetical protein